MARDAVIYCVTGAHLQLTAVSIASVVKNHSYETDLDILIITNEINELEIQNLKKIASLYGKKKITVNIWYPPEIVKQIQNYKNERFPEVTLWRLFLPSYFCEYERILYLDNDTLLYDDVSNIFCLVPKNKSIAAVRDFYFSVISDSDDCGAHFGVKTMKNYFNSGVLLFNVAKFNEIIKPEKILEMINKNEYLYLDQTVLNILCEESVHFLSYEYNYQKDDHWLFNWAKGTNPQKFSEIYEARETIKIRHFVEFEKHSMPWEHLVALDKCEKDFWDYLYTVKTLK